jgi:TRAP-type C4-dicarboxylate transport system permease small subunit
VSGRELGETAGGPSEGLPARPLDRTVEAAAVALFLVIFALVLAQIVFRYGLGAPLVWSEEAARYLYVWLAFLGWVVAARRGTHIAIGMLVERLPAAARRILDRLALALTALFALGLLGHGSVIAWRNRDVPMVTMPAGFWLVYAAVPVAGLLLLRLVLRRLGEGR